MNQPSPRLGGAQRSVGQTKRARVHAAIAQLVDDRQNVTIAAVARNARVSRTLCYGDPELRAAIDEHRAQPGEPTAVTRSSEASMRADLAHARSQLQQLDRDNQLLRERLTRNLGDELDQRLAQPQGARCDELEQRAIQLATENTGLREHVDRLLTENSELHESLTAARTMNRELMTRINSSAHR